MNSFEPQAPLLLLPLPVLHGERVGVRGRLRKFERREYAEAPPHPALRADLSPQAGRGEQLRTPISSDPEDSARLPRYFSPSPRSSRGEGGVRGCLRKFERRECAEAPPHPALRADLSPQAGRGEQVRTPISSDPEDSARVPRSSSPSPRSSRGEGGVRGCLRKFERREYAEAPPHPALRADLSPQAGRGEPARTPISSNCQLKV